MAPEQNEEAHKSEDEEESGKNKDVVAEGREQFLKIYKEKQATEEKNDEVVTSSEIKFRKDQDEDEDLETKEGRLLKLSQRDTTNGKPLI